MAKCADCRMIMNPHAARRVEEPGKRAKHVCPKCFKRLQPQPEAKVRTKAEAKPKTEPEAKLSKQPVEARPTANYEADPKLNFRLFLTQPTIRNIEKAISVNGGTDNCYRIIGVMPDEPERDPERFADLKEIIFVDGR